MFFLFYLLCSCRRFFYWCFFELMFLLFNIWSVLEFFTFDVISNWLFYFLTFVPVDMFYILHFFPVDVYYFLTFCPGQRFWSFSLCPSWRFSFMLCPIRHFFFPRLGRQHFLPSVFFTSTSVSESAVHVVIMFRAKKLYTLEGKPLTASVHPAAGGRLVYIYWFCTKKSEGVEALREVLQWNSSCFSNISQEPPDIFQTKPDCKLLLWQLLTLFYWAADSFPHDQTDKILTS